jgi:hypothetical protein
MVFLNTFTRENQEKVGMYSNGGVQEEGKRAGTQLPGPVDSTGLACTVPCSATHACAWDAHLLGTARRCRAMESQLYLRHCRACRHQVRVCICAMLAHRHILMVLFIAIKLVDQGPDLQCVWHFSNTNVRSHTLFASSLTSACGRAQEMPTSRPVLQL